MSYGFEAMIVRQTAAATQTTAVPPPQIVMPTQNRRDMSLSSGLSPASAVAMTGSNAIPQMGQLPGPI